MGQPLLDRILIIFLQIGQLTALSYNDNTNNNNNNNDNNNNHSNNKNNYLLKIQTITHVIQTTKFNSVNNNQTNKWHSGCCKSKVGSKSTIMCDEYIIID